jgi:hypothetical protein
MVQPAQAGFLGFFGFGGRFGVLSPMTWRPPAARSVDAATSTGADDGRQGTTFRSRRFAPGGLTRSGLAVLFQVGQMAIQTAIRVVASDVHTVDSTNWRSIMCLTCGCMQAHLEMGEANITYEDVKRAADENGRSVEETLDIIARTAEVDRSDHPKEYAA